MLVFSSFVLHFRRIRIFYSSFFTSVRVFRCIVSVHRRRFLTGSPTGLKERQGGLLGWLVGGVRGPGSLQSSDNEKGSHRE